MPTRNISNLGTNVPTLVGREDKAKATELMPQTTTIRWRLTLAAHMVARVGNIAQSGIAPIRQPDANPCDSGELKKRGALDVGCALFMGKWVKYTAIREDGRGWEPGRCEQGGWVMWH